MKDLSRQDLEVGRVKHDPRQRMQDMEFQDFRNFKRKFFKIRLENELVENGLDLFF